MKVKSKIFTSILIFFLGTISLVSQEFCANQDFTIKIDDVYNIPIVSESDIANTIKLTHKEQYITDIFSKYTIYGFERSVPTATSEALKTYYKISCSSKDLINELKSKVPETIFFIENNYESVTINQEIRNKFDKEKYFELKDYIFTSDGGACVFDCDLKPIPEGLEILLKIYYDAEEDFLVLENTEETSCLNSFKFKFKQAPNGNNINFVIWETISNATCKNVTNNSCGIEATFIETMLSKYFNLTFTFNEGSFIMKAPNGVFGEDVFGFQEKILSAESLNSVKSITIDPNPCKNFININQNTVTISKVAVFDYSGREILIVNDTFQKINLAKLLPGVYFLQIKTNNNIIINKKVVKL